MYMAFVVNHGLGRRKVTDRCDGAKTVLRPTPKSKKVKRLDWMTKSRTAHLENMDLYHRMTSKIFGKRDWTTSIFTWTFMAVTN
jgi:hypothetical protein